MGGSFRARLSLRSFFTGPKFTTTTTTTTHFGEREVPIYEKATLVSEVFDNVANNYDLMNDAMSLGLHRHWKNKLVQLLSPYPGMKLIDVAGGTEKQIEWVCDDAEKLTSIASSWYDAYSMAFGIRNCTSIPAVLEQAHRVLRSGGLLAILEFSPCLEGIPPLWRPLIQRVYDFYSTVGIPAIGAVVHGDRGPYQYLVESIRKFPTNVEFSRLIQEAGFSALRTEALTGGICNIHTAIKL